MEITRESISDWLKSLQDTICAGLENADGSSKFIEENWTRTEGGGGRTRILKDGAVIEKGGVLFSSVEGDAPDFLFKEKGKHLRNLKIGTFALNIGHKSPK